MNRFLKFLAFLIGALFLITVFGPREPVDWEIAFDPAEIGEDVDAYLSSYEARFDDITPGAEKSVVWAGQPGEVTPVSVIYIHGFSATKEETRPVPDLVAEALGANLYFARFAGHGRGSAGMTQATVNDWLVDMAEAIAIGERIGEKVLIMATSTGGTYATMLAVDHLRMQNVAGIAFISPNFGINSPVASLLTMPFAREILPPLFGRERSWEPANEEHGKWWTTSYPTVAVFPMAAAVREAVNLDLNGVTVPAFFAYSDADTVVKASATDQIVERWGGPTTVWKVTLGPGDDANSHNIAGRILSPGNTTPTVLRILEWFDSLQL